MLSQHSRPIGTGGATQTDSHVTPHGSQPVNSRTEDDEDYDPLAPLPDETEEEWQERHEFHYLTPGAVKVFDASRKFREQKAAEERAADRQESLDAAAEAESETRTRADAAAEAVEREHEEEEEVEEEDVILNPTPSSSRKRAQANEKDPTPVHLLRDPGKGQGTRARKRQRKENYQARLTEGGGGPPTQEPAAVAADRVDDLEALRQKARLSAKKLAASR